MTEPMTLRARARVPLAAARQAITDPTTLRLWLAEHVEVDPPDRFEFWGRTTPDGEPGRQKLLHLDDDGVRFAWTLDGVDTTTELSVAELPAGESAITVAQTGWDFQDIITGASIRGALQTYWALALANLVDVLEGRPTTPMPDLTSPELAADLVIDAPVEAVWASMTDSAVASEWFGFPVGIEPWEGGRFAMGGFDADPAPATVTAVTPGRAMSVDWGPSGVSTWQLEGSEGRTHLTIVQSGFAGDRLPPYASWLGTLSGLASLRRYHELPGTWSIWLDPTSA
jgi:uncharacterized protein YndB with AHSA1/START domain